MGDDDMRKFWMIGLYGILSGVVLFGVVFLIKLPDILEQRILRKRQILEQEENRKKEAFERRQKELQRQQRIAWEKRQYFFNHLDLSQIKMMRQTGELDFEVVTQIFQQLHKRSSRIQQQVVKVISQVIIETNDFDFLWWSMQIEKQQLSSRYVPEILINVAEKIIVEDLPQQHTEIKTSNVKNNFLFVFHKTKTLRAVTLLIRGLNDREFEQRSHKVLVSFLNYHFSSIGDEKIAQATLDILVQEYFRHPRYRENIVRVFLELNIGLQKIWAMNNQLSLDSILQICEQLPLDNLVVRQRAIENICNMIVQTKRFDLLWQNTSDDLSNTTLTEIILRIHEMVDLEEIFVQNWQNIKRFSVKKALFSVLENTQSLDTINMLIALLEEITLEGKARETLATILNNLRLTNNDLATKIQQRLVAKYQQGNTSLRANIIVIFSRLQSKDNTIIEILEKASDDPNRFIKMLAKKLYRNDYLKKQMYHQKKQILPLPLQIIKRTFCRR